jgi:osmotically-inducible protein OsmY
MVRKLMVLLVPWVVVVSAGLSLAKTGPVLSNAQVTAEIQDKIYHANVFKHGAVQVNFSDGVARLTGTVDSLGVKMDAERAARKVDEVNSVADQITVAAPNVTDQQIVERARKEIVTYPFYTIFDYMTLKSDNGTLTVTGAVTDPYKKSDIGNFLAHVRGVSALNNEIQVMPASFYDTQLRRAIARAIYRDPYFLHYGNQALPPIHVIVQNGNVTLTGVVNSPVDKAKAESDARFAATFFSLTNDLRVEG